MTDSGRRELIGRSLHPGSARARLVRLEQPLSFWGGVDRGGAVVEARHPQYGVSLSGRVVVLTVGRGSSSSTAVLAELIRAGAAPAALLLAECDTILVTGALVAAEIYGRSMPIIQLSGPDLSTLTTGIEVELQAGPAPSSAWLRVGR